VNNGGTLPATFQNLFNLTGGSLGAALSQLDGEAATGAEHTAFQMMTGFLGLVLDPFVDGRFGGGSVAGGGQAIGFAPNEAQFLPPDVALAYASILNQTAAPVPFVQHWTAWGSSYGGGQFTSGNATVGSSNLSSQIFGFAGGMDYHYSPDTIVGFALGGAGLNWGLSGGLGGGRSNSFQSGVYGITRFGPAYVAGSVAFGNHWMTTSRSALGDQLNATFDAQSYGARIEGGYRYAVLPSFGVTPYAALQPQAFHTPGYSETDAAGGGLGLTYASMNATDVRTEIGARLDSPMVVGGTPLILRGRLAWAHDFVSNPSLGAAFASLPGTNFVVNGAPIPNDSTLVSAGAEFYLTPRWTLLAKFDGEFAGGSQSYGGSGTLRYIW
jgi:outer membrane autotransporter protein